ncbi:MAG: acyl-CoA-binding protein [Staphylococcus aureus]|nr:acyl-CoA-binding protein [Staphylococcus aureus]
MCRLRPASCIWISLTPAIPDRVFVHALNTVKRIPRTGTARPPAAERLALYGLYKQSMGECPQHRETQCETGTRGTNIRSEGDVEGVMDRPIGNTPEVHAECEKWYVRNARGRRS